MGALARRACLVDEKLCHFAGLQLEKICSLSIANTVSHEETVTINDELPPLGILTAPGICGQVA